MRCGPSLHAVAINSYRDISLEYNPFFIRVCFNPRELLVKKELNEVPVSRLPCCFGIYFQHLFKWSLIVVTKLLLIVEVGTLVAIPQVTITRVGKKPGLV